MNTYFSIVIPTYNRASLLKRCLDSVLSQTYQNWEAIIIDNYSEDNTEEIVKSYNEPRFRYLKNHNYGVIAVSRNKALDMAEGDWVAFLDSDDAWMPKKLETVLPYTKDYDLIYHGYRRDEEKKGILHKIDNYFYEIKESSVPYVLIKGDPINPSCACVSKTVLGETRFDESKELFAVEDYDFFLQLIHKGIKIKYLHEILTLYDVNGCSHNYATIDRDFKVIKKWEYVLTDEQKREVELAMEYKKGAVYSEDGKYKEALEFYRNAFKSHYLSKKWYAFRGMGKCILYELLKK